jgi:sulfinoalanine decarboxylase
MVGLQAFPDPSLEDPILERFLLEASRQLQQWWATAAQRPPLPLLSVLPDVAPRLEGLSPETLLADLQLVMEGAYNPCHPGALAHLDPPPLSASVVADLVAAGLNNNLLAEELSPSLSRLERSLCRWIAARLGMGDQAGGVAASGGSLSNLMALVVARHRAGLAGRSDALVFCSADAHVSLAKAVAVMGLPSTALHALPVDPSGAVRLDALEDALARCEQQGIPVIAVVGTAGTTVRGAVDPLGPMARVCASRGVWLHVDGAIGAVFGLTDGQAGRVPDLGQADSLTVNPQKVLGITKTSSLLLLQQPEHLAACFGTGLPYMEPSWGEAHGGECGLQGTRPAEVLKLWLGLRQLGLNGIDTVLASAIARRQRLQVLLEPLPLQIITGPLHLLAFTPLDVSSDAAERWSTRTRQKLLEAQLMLSRPVYGGRHYLKAVLGNPHTSDAELNQLTELVAASLSPSTP